MQYQSTLEYFKYNELNSCTGTYFKYNCRWKSVCWGESKQESRENARCNCALVGELIGEGMRNIKS